MSIDNLLDADFVSVQAAAVRSGFSESAIRNRVRAGQIPTRKLGPRCLVVSWPHVAALANFGSSPR